MGNINKHQLQPSNLFYKQEEINYLQAENAKILAENAKIKNELQIKELEEDKVFIYEEFKKEFEQLQLQLAVHTKHQEVQTGLEFKMSFGGQDKLFVKWMNKDMKHYNFQYKEGLNEDIVQFNPTGYCGNGGLYFTTMEYQHQWIIKDGTLRLIEIPDDAKVYWQLGDNKWKADKIIVRKVIPNKFIKMYNFLYKS